MKNTYKVMRLSSTCIRVKDTSCKATYKIKDLGKNYWVFMRNKVINNTFK